MLRRASAGGRVRRRTRAAAVGCALTLALTLAACGGDDPDPRTASARDTAGAPTTDPTTDPATDPTTDPATPEVDTAADPAVPDPVTATGLDPALAVAAPGPLEGSLESPDLLISAPTTLDPATVAALAAVPGVTASLPLDLGSVPVEGRVLTVLAVDPSSYRRWTRAASATLQDVWDRVARGEVAVPPEVDKQLIDGGGYLQLGMTQDAPAIHVGAYAPQVPSVDAVVNQKWGEQLALPTGNALLLSTGITSPSTVQKKVQKLLAGQGLTVQALDAVAQYGLDPDAQQQAFLVGSVADAVGTFRYSVIPGGGGRIAPEPSWVASHISTEVVPILGSVTCNTKLFPQLKAALAEVVARGLADEINPGEYAGCYYPRFIAGSNRLSNHSFGLALDFNVPGNLRGTVGEMDRGVVDAFKRWGFAWGGDWSYTDPMHFEMARLVNPGSAG